LKELKVTILAIGDEILIGQITDTNSQWIANELTKLGFTISKMLTVGDDKEAINSSIKDNQNDLLIITGGLGPTSDDITKDTLVNFFSSKLVIHKPTLNHLTNHFVLLGKEFDDLSKTQTYLPDNCKVLPNDFGTAPGMWFNYARGVVVSLPGVPFEMQSIWETIVVPELKKKFTLPNICHKTLHTIGISEVDLAERLVDWEKNLPSNVGLAYLPRLGTVRLRLTIVSRDDNSNQVVLQPLIESLYSLVGQFIFGEGTTSIELEIGKLLLSQAATIATAESCTGGNIGHLLTSVSGSSRYFNGGIISYSNEVKIASLSIPREVIMNEGAVSEQTVSFMATNVRKLLNSTYGLAVTGVAGPEGGTEEKPIGTVWIAFSSEERIVTKKLQLTPHREKNIQLSSVLALDLLRKNLINH